MKRMVGNLNDESQFNDSEESKDIVPSVSLKDTHLYGTHMPRITRARSTIRQTQQIFKFEDVGVSGGGSPKNETLLRRTRSPSLLSNLSNENLKKSKNILNPLSSGQMAGKRAIATFHTPKFEPMHSEITNFVRGRMNTITSPKAVEDPISEVYTSRKKAISSLIPSQDIKDLESQFDQILNKQNLRLTKN